MTSEKILLWASVSPSNDDSARSIRLGAKADVIKTSGGLGPDLGTVCVRQLWTARPGEEVQLSLDPRCPSHLLLPLGEGWEWRRWGGSWAEEEAPPPVC